MHPLIETHRAEHLALASRHGVTGVRAFGSTIRGDHTDESDVDLLVTLAPGTSALALGGLLLDAQALLGRRVDVVTESSLHPALFERAEKRGQVLAFASDGLCLRHGKPPVTILHYFDGTSAVQTARCLGFFHIKGHLVFLTRSKARGCKRNSKKMSVVEAR